MYDKRCYHEVNGVCYLGYTEAQCKKRQCMKDGIVFHIKPMYATLKGV